MDYIHALQTHGPKAHVEHGWLMALGILNIVLGIFAVIFTGFSTYISVLYIGWLLTFSGLATLYFALQLKRINGHGSSFIFGVLAVVFGILMLRDPLHNALFLTMLAATFIFISGVVNLVSCFFAPFKGRRWMVFTSSASIACGIMIYAQMPESGTWVLGTLFGIYLVLNGMTQVQIGSSGRVVRTEFRKRPH